MPLCCLKMYTAPYDRSFPSAATSFREACPRLLREMLPWNLTPLFFGARVAPCAFFSSAVMSLIMVSSSERMMGFCCSLLTAVKLAPFAARCIAASYWEKNEAKCSGVLPSSSATLGFTPGLDNEVSDGM